MLDYYMALSISNSPHPGKRKLFLSLSLLSNLGVLFIFKYFIWLHNLSLTALGFNQQLSENFIIPAGLSFYTFQSLSYIIDVYRNKYKAADSVWDFLLFVSFFPHMVAGPIVRYHTLMPQLKAISYFKSIDWGDFAKLCIWGYFKKMVIADNLALLVNKVFGNVTQYSAAELFLAGSLFLVQLYCDFSGYSDIATGVAKLFNINLSINWRRPFFATSVHDFWKRYHISLTTWFRDYLYVGLGGNRVSSIRWIRNILLVFLISGLWHGANFTFVVWGLLHALFYLLESGLKKLLPQTHLPALFNRIYLMLVLIFSFIAFRANSLMDLSYVYRKFFHFGADYFSINHLLSQNDRIYFALLVFVMGVLFIKEWHEEKAHLNRFTSAYRLLKPIFYVFILGLIFITGNFGANTFIYFQF
jgi:alginate O-acetyltransferase complex protein AlgI